MHLIVLIRNAECECNNLRSNLVAFSVSRFGLSARHEFLKTMIQIWQVDSSVLLFGLSIESRDRLEGPRDNTYRSRHRV